MSAEKNKIQGECPREEDYAMVYDEAAAEFLAITEHRMRSLYLPKLTHALNAVNREQLWAETYPGSNTTGGITLHVCEHIHRSSLRLSGRHDLLAADFQHFFPDAGLAPVEVIARLETTVEEWRQCLRPYRQGEADFTREHIHELYHLVEHTGYHLGQIIDRIQGVTGDHFDYYSMGWNEQYLRDRIEAERG